jgi:hypothetical protein
MTPQHGAWRSPHMPHFLARLYQSIHSINAIFIHSRIQRTQVDVALSRPIAYIFLPGLGLFKRIVCPLY